MKPRGTKSACKLRPLRSDRYVKEVAFDHPDDKTVRTAMIRAMSGQKLRSGHGITITIYQHLDAGTLRTALRELDDAGVLQSCSLDYWRRADGSDLPVVDVKLKRRKRPR